MEQERDFEPAQDNEFVDNRVELFGDSSVPPSFYYCIQCEEEVLAQDVVWDQAGQPHCPKPKCNSILESRSG